MVSHTTLEETPTLLDMAALVYLPVRHSLHISARCSIVTLWGSFLLTNGVIAPQSPQVKRVPLAEIKP